MNVRSFFFCFLLAVQGVVTYEFSGGRFGDNLLAYLHAKWFAEKNHLPLLYRPFPYSSFLRLDEEKSCRKEPWLKVPLAKFPLLSQIPLLKLCYECPYFSEDPSEKQDLPFQVDWKDPEFRRCAREWIAPKQELSLVKPPEGSISIAIHVREGGGFDVGSCPLDLPLKFPPLSFYIDGLNYVAALFPEQPLYCHLFTDAKAPEKVAEELQRHFPHLQIHYREENNNWETNVLEDFFSLFHFDVLIRPQSSFSIIPSLLQEYQVVYSPRHYVIQGKSVAIIGADIQRDEIFFPSAPYLAKEAFRLLADAIYPSFEAQEIKAGSTIFVKTDALGEFFRDMHPKIASPYVLITHESEASAPGDYASYLQDEKLLAWFAENYDGYLHPKIHPIPTGLHNLQQGEAIQTVQRRHPPKKHLVYAGEPKKKYKRYLKDLANARFVKTSQETQVWEALYMGSIPIVKSSSLDPLYRDLPVLILSDGEEITEELLQKRTLEFEKRAFSLEKLSISYWQRRINSYKQI